MSVTNDHEGLTLLGTFDKQHFRFTPFSYCIAWPHNHWRRNPPLKEEEERLLTWRPVYPALIVGKVDCLLHEGTRVSCPPPPSTPRPPTPTTTTPSPGRQCAPALIVGKVHSLLHEGTWVSSTLQGHLLQHTTPTLMTQLGLLRGQT